MNNIEDLKEILTAMQEIGNAWHAENISLRNLIKENEELRAENESLRREFDILSEKIVNLKEELHTEILTKQDKLRDEILKELDVKGRENFQKDVRDFLGDIRKKLKETTVKAEEPSLYQEQKVPTPAQDKEEVIQILGNFYD